MEIRFGQGELIPLLLEDMAHRRGFGAIMALGVRGMSERWGEATQRFAMHCKGMELGGYDPRAIRGFALTYACGPRGGCHHAGGFTAFKEAFSGQYDPHGMEGKAQLVKAARERRVVDDSLILCTFNTMSLENEIIRQLLNAALGIDFQPADLLLVGKRGSIIERLFNVREGLRRSWDIVPPRLLRESVPEGPSKGQIVELEPLLDAFYELCGWDKATGIPLAEKVASLNLPDLLGERLREW